VALHNLLVEVCRGHLWVIVREEVSLRHHTHTSIQAAVDQKVALWMDPMLCSRTSGLWTSDVPLARYMLLQFSLTGRNVQFELISKFLYKPSPLTVQLHNVEISYATQVF